jgi:uncharacterized membrane protein YvbJ
MPYCQKCGTEVSEEMTFCPKCGASLKVEKPVEAAPAPAPKKTEKAEKHEKEEKREKAEKREKREFGVIGPLIGGLILILLGLMLYLQVTGFLQRGVAGALFLITLGIIVIVAGLYAATTAARRHPRA